MNEKNVSMEDAFQVWWFIAWRTALTQIVLSVLAGILGGLLAGNGVMEIVIDYTVIILSILIAVFYVKMALNRDYRTLRLSAREK